MRPTGLQTFTAGSRYRKAVLFMRISFGKSVLFSLDIKAWRDSQQLSVSVSEKALRKQAVKDSLHNTCGRVG